MVDNERERATKIDNILTQRLDETASHRFFAHGDDEFLGCGGQRVAAELVDLSKTGQTDFVGQADPLDGVGGENNVFDVIDATDAEGLVSTDRVNGGGGERSLDLDGEGQIGRGVVVAVVHRPQRPYRTAAVTITAATPNDPVEICSDSISHSSSSSNFSSSAAKRPSTIFSSTTGVSTTTLATTGSFDLLLLMMILFGAWDRGSGCCCGCGVLFFFSCFDGISFHAFVLGSCSQAIPLGGSGSDSRERILG